MIWSHIRRTTERAGRYVHQGLTHARHFAQQVDSGVRAAKTIYGAVAPILDSYAGGGHAKHVMKALQGYDDLRQQVLGHAENANAVAGAVRRAVPGIGL